MRSGMGWGGNILLLRRRNRAQWQGRTMNICHKVDIGLLTRQALSRTGTRMVQLSQVENGNGPNINTQGGW